MEELTEEEKELLRQIDMGPRLTVGKGHQAPGLQLRDPSNVVGDNELAESLKRDSGGSISPDFDVEEIDGGHFPAPEPDRPQFLPLSKSQTGPQRDEPGFYKTDEIKKLLEDLDVAQAKDKTKKKGDRRRYWALMAGEAASAGFQNRKMQDVGTPPPAPDETTAVLQRGKFSDTLQTGEMKRQNPAEERELKDLLKRLELQKKAEEALKNRNWKDDDREDKQEFTGGVEEMKEHGRNKRTDKLIRAGLAGKILQMYSSASTAGARSDAEYANKQATYQIPEWDQMKPNSQGDHTDGAKLAGAEKAFNEVGKRLADGLRKNGPAFLRSTEWDEVAGDYMALNQVLNHLNNNGVMNFKDKDNNDVQIGNAQALVQYVLQNGPEVLEHAMATMRTSTDAKMSQFGYKRHAGQWNPKNPKDYAGQGAGGGSARNHIDPNAAGGLGKWAIEGGDMPPVAPPTATPPQTPAIPGQAPVDPYAPVKKRKVVTIGPDGNPIVIER